METQTGPKNLENIAHALEQSGCSWVLSMSDRDSLLHVTARELADFLAEYKRRFATGATPDPFALLDANPSKGTAFFRTFVGATISVAMRVLVWRLLVGEEIDSLVIQYHRGQAAQIRIVMRGDSEPYESNSLWDFQVIRNLGLLSIDGMPFFDGYFVPID